MMASARLNGLWCVACGAAAVLCLLHSGTAMFASSAISSLVLVSLHNGRRAGRRRRCGQPRAGRRARGGAPGSRAAQARCAQRPHAPPAPRQACIEVVPSNPANFNVDNVRVVKIPGGGAADARVVRGLVVKRGAEGAVQGAADAKVAVFAQGVDTSSTETKARARLTPYSLGPTCSMCGGALLTWSYVSW